jgi:hypothetical protein
MRAQPLREQVGEYFARVPHAEQQKYILSVLLSFLVLLSFFTFVRLGAGSRRQSQSTTQNITTNITDPFIL